MNRADETAPQQFTEVEEQRIREAALDKTIADSFPASDPPSSNPNPCEPDVLEECESD